MGALPQLELLSVLCVGFSPKKNKIVFDIIFCVHYYLHKYFANVLLIVYIKSYCGLFQMII